MFEVKHEIERILNVNINAWIPCEICLENEPRHQNNKWCQCVDLESTYQKHVAMLLEKSSREDQLTFSIVKGFCHPTLTWLAQFRKKNYWKVSPCPMVCITLKASCQLSEEVPLQIYSLGHAIVFACFAFGIDFFGYACIYIEIMWICLDTYILRPKR